MSPELTLTDRSDLELFLDLWRDKTERSGDAEYAYIWAAINHWEGELVYRRLSRLSCNNRMVA